MSTEVEIQGVVARLDQVETLRDQRRDLAEQIATAEEGLQEAVSAAFEAVPQGDAVVIGDQVFRKTGAGQFRVHGLVNAADGDSKRQARRVRQFLQGAGLLGGG